MVSRTSSMYYRGTTRRLPAIAKELDVDLVVEASVARQADHVRVTVQLIEAASDSHVWSQTYDRRMRDVLALQADVTRAIAQELRAEIAPRQERALAERAGLPADVIDDYLRGRAAFDRRAPRDLAEATTLFASRSLPALPRLHRRMPRLRPRGACGRSMPLARRRHAKRSTRPKPRRSRHCASTRGMPTPTSRSPSFATAATGSGERLNVSSCGCSNCARATSRRTSGTRSSWPSRAVTIRPASRRRAPSRWTRTRPPCIGRPDWWRCTDAASAPRRRRCGDRWRWTRPRASRACCWRRCCSSRAGMSRRERWRWSSATWNCRTSASPCWRTPRCAWATGPRQRGIAPRSRTCRGRGRSWPKRACVPPSATRTPWSRRPRVPSSSARNWPAALKVHPLFEPVRQAVAFQALMRRVGLS